MLLAPTWLWAVAVLGAGEPSDPAWIAVPAEAVAGLRFPSVDTELTSLAREYQPIAAKLGLCAYFGADPPVVLFAPDDAHEGAWLVRLAQQTILYFRAQYGHDAPPTRPMAQFWVDD